MCEHNFSISSSPFLYLVQTEFRVDDKHVTGGPQTALFLTSPAKVTVLEIIGGLHGDQTKESSVIGTAGAEC